EPGIDAPHLAPATVLRMATKDGASTTPFTGSIGELRPGMSADLVVLDWQSVTHPFQSEDLRLVDVLVHRAKPSAVHTVMIGGEVVYAERRFTRIDREAVLADIAARLADPLTSAEEERRRLARAVMPHVQDFYDG